MFNDTAETPVAGIPAKPPTFTFVHVFAGVDPENTAPVTGTNNPASPVAAADPVAAGAAVAANADAGATIASVAVIAPIRTAAATDEDKRVVIHERRVAEQRSRKDKKNSQQLVKN